jgi:hypothetical protein
MITPIQQNDDEKGGPILAVRFSPDGERMFGGVCSRTLATWAKLPEDPLPTVKIGQTVLIPVDLAKAWLERRAAK